MKPAGRRSNPAACGVFEYTMANGEWRISDSPAVCIRVQRVVLATDEARRTRRLRAERAQNIREVRAECPQNVRGVRVECYQVCRGSALQPADYHLIAFAAKEGAT